MSTRPAPTPRFAWQPGDAVAVLWTSIGGLAALVVSFIGVSGSDDRDTQTVWIAVGIGGVVLAAVGNAVWLAAGARAVAARRRSVVVRLDAWAGPSTIAGPSFPATVTAGLPVATAAMTRYHRPDCPLVRGKPAEAADPTDHRARGRRPCGVCRPDGHA